MSGAALADLPVLAASLPGLERIAESRAPCLIVGEPGTGRSSLARWLHRNGARASAPLVVVDPGSIPATLFESELFGHERGAFTGAESAQSGRVAKAEGGTLLLDHVEALPLELQPKLLRLLAEGRYRPLGGAERQSDVRFVAVGAEDLPDRVDSGTFRLDLYHRLEVLAVRIPPLRDQLDRLPGLLDSVASDLEARFGVRGIEVSEGAREWMRAYRWPGNVRQLKNLLERSLVVARGGRLDPPPPADLEGEGPPASLAEVEKAQIRRALAYTRGHQGRAAELLGISRKALWQKRKRYDIP